jgi:catechol 2,3-dioxygenase-like lactoylglutathione lyase family enzyme
MINAAHVVIYSRDAEADRAFFRDVLDFSCVDAGEGWLIFALPPAELGIHPTGPGRESIPNTTILAGHHQLYFMCDDVEASVRELEGKGVKFAEPLKDVGWGVLTALQLPGGSRLYLYQPRHASPIKK